LIDNENNYYYFVGLLTLAIIMNRRLFLQRSLQLSALTATSVGAGSLLTACGGADGTGETVTVTNHYRQVNLVASSASYQPVIVEPLLIDAWGIAIRPAGAGGHFWVTAMGHSFEYVGDVNGQPISQDGLKDVALPPSGDNEGAANGVVFNGGNGFVITQMTANGSITAAAKFIFVSDNGVISAWTERKNADGSVDRPVDALTVVDMGAAGSSFFGVAITPDNQSLIAVDFGVNPTPCLRLFDQTFTEQSLNGRFANPFIQGAFKAGDLVPFNVQTISHGTTSSVFVTYVNTLEDPEHAGQWVAATESAGRGRGRLVEYATDGTLIAIWNDRGVLNAPWGVALAPANFGPFSNQLLVSNFSDGTIVGFDLSTRQVTEYMRDSNGNILKIAGLWNLLFGNGASLGDSNALYFAAGPADETEGLFGALRHVG
jgi:uncharacterized protein (TIGR03118 family)